MAPSQAQSWNRWWIAQIGSWQAPRRGIEVVLGRALCEIDAWKLFCLFRLFKLQKSTCLAGMAKPATAFRTIPAHKNVHRSAEGAGFKARALQQYQERFHNLSRHP